MSKTPEELAEEYINHVLESQCDCSYRIAFFAGYQAAKDQLADADKVMPQWISVKDRLPEDGVEVLVVSDGETGASWHEAGEFGWAIGGTVTHWAPLPKPPEE
jgi:hypothetical protein